VRKKSAVKISADTGARGKISFSPAIRKSKGWLAVGFDVSVSSIAGCAVGYDAILKKKLQPNFTSWRWAVGTHYFDRISDCARSHQYVEDLQFRSGVMVELDEIYIAVEEPWPFGMVKQMESQALKQQAEISGAFIGGLLRYGYTNVFQISANQWRQIVAAELGITIHHTKYNYTENPFQFAPSGRGSGKWRSKEYGLKFGLPDWPDIIQSTKQGKIPRPETSKAKAVQPDDRYDAFPIANWMEAEYLRGVDNRPRDDSIGKVSSPRKARKKRGKQKTN